MIKTERVYDEYGSYNAQHDEYKTNCYCSECNEFLGSKDFTYCITRSNKLNPKMRYCPYCGKSLYD